MDNPKFTTKDVSVVCALLNPPQIFPECLKSWLGNNPKEVILVTIGDCYDNVLVAIQSYDLTEDDRAKIKVLHAGLGIHGQRLQHAMGFVEVTGNIMAVTDDQILWSEHTLESSKSLAFLVISHSLLVFSMLTNTHSPSALLL